MFSTVGLLLGLLLRGLSTVSFSPSLKRLCQNRTCVLHIVASPKTPFNSHQAWIGVWPHFTRNFKLTLCSSLAVNLGLANNNNNCTKTPNMVKIEQENTKCIRRPIWIRPLTWNRRPDRQSLRKPGQTKGHASALNCHTAEQGRSIANLRFAKIPNQKCRPDQKICARIGNINLTPRIDTTRKSKFRNSASNRCTAVFSCSWNKADLLGLRLKTKPNISDGPVEPVWGGLAADLLSHVDWDVAHVGLSLHKIQNQKCSVDNLQLFVDGYFHNCVHRGQHHNLQSGNAFFIGLHQSIGDHCNTVSQVITHTNLSVQVPEVSRICEAVERIS